ncbi:MAG TPA: T9SS type A sorting domain-containing protein [Cytophagaceae bacterium]
MTPSNTATPSLSVSLTPTPSPSSVINSVEEALKANGIEVGTFNPNPTADRSFLVVISKQPINVKVDVFDISSRNVFSKYYSLRSGSNSLEVELPSGPPSFYQVLIDFGGQVVARRIMTK